MWKLFLGPFAILVAGTIDAAVAQNYPYCLRGCDFGAGDCSYYTYGQCRAAASGREAWCDVNPFFRQSHDVQPTRHSRSRL